MSLMLSWDRFNGKSLINFFLSSPTSSGFNLRCKKMASSGFGPLVFVKPASFIIFKQHRKFNLKFFEGME